MREKPIIGLDVDGVVADMAQAMISIYNYKSVCEGSPPFIHNDVYRVQDLKHHDISSIIGKECFLAVAGVMQTNKVCMSMPVYDGAKKMYSDLCDIGDVVFVTKPFTLYKDWYVERNAWLKKNFGVSTDDIIYTGKKHLIDVDILIDDFPYILEGWSNNTDKPAIKIERPWNKDFSAKNVHTAGSIRDVPMLVKELLNG